jgi:hypothetical protein
VGVAAPLRVVLTVRLTVNLDLGSPGFSYFIVPFRVPYGLRLLVLVGVLHPVFVEFLSS